MGMNKSVQEGGMYTNVDLPGFRCPSADGSNEFRGGV
jgi:hypothetical protein